MLASRIDITPEGICIFRTKSPLEASKIEKLLQEQLVSYKTKIITTKKYGLEYVITVLEDFDIDRFMEFVPRGLH